MRSLEPRRRMRLGRSIKGTWSRPSSCKTSLPATYVRHGRTAQNCGTTTMSGSEPCMWTDAVTVKIFLSEMTVLFAALKTFADAKLVKRQGIDYVATVGSLCVNTATMLSPATGHILSTWDSATITCGATSQRLFTNTRFDGWRWLSLLQCGLP